MDSNHRCLDVGQESLPLDHGTIAVAEVGIEPTNSHQALDLAALPICVLGRSSCGGRIRTGVVRLMRPCWKPDSSPLRNLAPPMGFEPTFSTLTGWRALRAA